MATSHLVTAPLIAAISGRVSAAAAAQRLLACQIRRDHLHGLPDRRRVGLGGRGLRVGGGVEPLLEQRAAHVQTAADLGLTGGKSPRWRNSVWVRMGRPMAAMSPGARIADIRYSDVQAR